MRYLSEFDYNQVYEDSEHNCNNMIFKTKIVNDELYCRNGEQVRIIEKLPDNTFVTIQFIEDGYIATVLKSELT